MPAPRSRPTNLPKLGSVPDALPISMPSKFDDDTILDWAEKTRDHFEEKGKFMSVGQLRQLVEKPASGLNADDQKAVRKQLSRLYREEIDARKTESSPTPAKSSSDEQPKKKAKKKKSKPVSEPKPSKKESKKMKAASTKPSKNGKHTAKNGKPAKKSSNPIRGGESTVIYEASIKGVPVEVRKSESGHFQVKIGEYAMRKLMQWMGADGWNSEQAFNVCSRLLRKASKLGADLNGEYVKGPDAYVRAVLNEGHIGSGARSKGKKEGSFGVSPTVEGSLAKTLRRLRKSSAVAAE